MQGIGKDRPWSWERARDRLAGLLVSTCVSKWLGTLEYRATFVDSTVYTASPDFRGPFIGIAWHDSLLIPIYLGGHSDSVLLTSLHRDANWITAAAHFFGFDTVRGSTYRGGRKALLTLLRSIRGRNIGFACDGPRGPRHHVSQGPIYLSSRLGVPIVTYGVGYSSCWRLNSWDRFVVPRPYSRVHVIFSRRIQVPPRADRAELEEYRLLVEREMRASTEDAQAWADTGQRRAGQVILQRRPMPAAVKQRFRQETEVTRAA